LKIDFDRFAMFQRETRKSFGDKKIEENQKIILGWREYEREHKEKGK